MLMCTKCGYITRSADVAGESGCRSCRVDGTGKTRRTGNRRKAPGAKRASGAKQRRGGRAGVSTDCLLTVCCVFVVGLLFLGGIDAQKKATEQWFSDWMAAQQAQFVAQLHQDRLVLESSVDELESIFRRWGTLVLRAGGSKQMTLVDGVPEMEKMRRDLMEAPMPVFLRLSRPVCLITARRELLRLMAFQQDVVMRFVSDAGLEAGDGVQMAAVGIPIARDVMTHLHGCGNLVLRLQSF